VTRRSEHDLSKPMQAIRIIAATLAAALCALGLSVGAAMAEDHSHPSKPVTAGQSAPKGLCIIHDLAS
jgi:hypothetical protein